VNLVDANVLLYAVDEDAPLHSAAISWLDPALASQEAVGFAWTVLLAFVRLSSHPSVFPSPLQPDQAFGVVESWLDQPASVVVEPTIRHLAVLRGLIEPLGTAANLVNDAHLAALAVEHGAEIVSFDSDFGRFPGVRWRRPN
jgi:toxin-antitoxin system PIN domain toxin